MSGKLKEIKERMKAVKDTQQITKAMKMVSAAKLRRATDAITQMRPYSSKLDDMLDNVVASLGDEDLAIDFAKVREVKKALVVIITSDRGLCGSFNANLIKTTRHTLENDTYAPLVKEGKVTLMTIGKKGKEFFTKRHDVRNEEYTEMFSDLSFSNVSNASEYILEAFKSEEFDRVEVVYSQFKNAATQEFVADQFLPIVPEVNEDTKASDFIFEPMKEEILKDLVPKILKTKFYRYLLDSNASEHGARMTSMDKASENCNELLGDLGIEYNRARQAAITTELSEIVGGAAALAAG